MKNIKKTLLTLLLISMLLSLLCACKGGKSEPKNDDTKSDSSYKLNIDGYKIIRAYSSSADLHSSFGNLRDALIEKTGIEKFVFAYDLDLEDEGGCEILLGKTNRKESIDALNELSEKTKKEAFIIKLTDKKIVITGHSDDDIRVALIYFTKNFVKTLTSKDKTLVFPKKDYTFMQKTGELHAVCNEGNNAVLISGLTTIYSPSDPLSEKDYSYAKIIKLEHQADKKNNGILIASNQNNTGDPWDIYHSYDDGKTWEESPKIEETVNPNYSEGYQPYLFELPVDIGEFKKGTVLFAACSYNGKYTKLPLFASTDQGKTWTGLHNIAEGGAYNQGDWSSDGVWEPCIVYDDKSGRLYCFYSDELENGDPITHEGGNNQRLVYKYTDDLKTWSKEYNAVALGEKRPGMAMVTKMGNGQWALVYEHVGNGGTPVYIKFTDDINNWNPSDPGKLLATEEGQYFGSSPSIAWTPMGGECGTLIATGFGNVAGSKGTKCDLFLSFDYGKTFVTVKNPIPVTWNDNVSSGYGSGFYVDSSGTLYYTNDPELRVGLSCGKLMFVKIRFF